MALYGPQIRRLGVPASDAVRQGSVVSVLTTVIVHNVAGRDQKHSQAGLRTPDFVTPSIVIEHPGWRIGSQRRQGNSDAWGLEEYVVLSPIGWHLVRGEFRVHRAASSSLRPYNESLQLTRR